MDNNEQALVEQEARQVWMETFTNLLSRGIWTEQAIENADQAYNAFRKTVVGQDNTKDR